MDLADIISLSPTDRNQYFTTGTTKKEQKLLNELKHINPEIVGAIERGSSASLFVDIPTTKLGERYGLSTYQVIKLPDVTDFHSCVDFARDVYFKEGIIRTVIDLMIDFSCTKFENISDDKTVKDFFDKHCMYADMDNILRQVFLEYFLIEDVFVYRGEAKTVTKGPDSGTIFYPYTVLNPSQVEVIGSLLFDGSIIAVKTNADLKRALTEFPNLKSYFLRNTPKEFRKLLEKDSEIAVIPLNPEQSSRISRRRQDYQRYAVPFVMSAASPLMIKRRLREMDLATAEGNINTLVTLTIGNDTYPATAQQLKALATLLKTGGKSMELIWNHTLKVEFHRPDYQALSAAKYEELDQDIVNSLGMPVVLINGGGSNFANSWVSILSLIERLERARHNVKRWMESEYRVIADERNLPSAPQVRFRRMNLRDEKVFKNIIMSLYDRGILDIRTVLDDADFDYDAIVEGKKKDKKQKELFASPWEPYASGPQTPSPPPAPKPGAYTDKTGRPPAEKPGANTSPNYPRRGPVKNPKDV